VSLDEEPERICQLLGPPIGTDRDGPRTEVGTGRLRGDAPENLLDCGEIRRLSRAYLEHVAADTTFQLGGRASRDRAAMIDDHHTPGQLVSLLQILGGEEHVGPVGNEITDCGPKLHPAARVEARGWLVEQQQLRSTNQTRAQIEPLTHTARICAHQAVARITQLQPLQNRRRGRARPPTVKAEEPSGEFEVLTAGHRRLHRRRLARQPDHAANARRLRSCIDSRHKQLTAIGTDQCRNCADEGRLPRAVRAKQGSDLAGLGDEIETIQRRDFVETLVQPTSLDDHCHGLTSLSWRIGISSPFRARPLNRRIGVFTMYDKTERVNVTCLPQSGSAPQRTGAA
jgi:hypothetical protein